jgi:hypothetical protein
MLVTIYQINSPALSFEASAFDTVGSMLENINKYRGPENQIQDLYLDSARKQKANADWWLFFNTVFYTLSVSPSAAVAVVSKV